MGQLFYWTSKLINSGQQYPNQKNGNFRFETEKEPYYFTIGLVYLYYNTKKHEDLAITVVEDVKCLRKAINLDYPRKRQGQDIITYGDFKHTMRISKILYDYLKELGIQLGLRDDELKDRYTRALIRECVIYGKVLTTFNEQDTVNLIKDEVKHAQKRRSNLKKSDKYM